MNEKIILVVDDEEVVRSALARVLERDGYRVHLAENAQQGLEVLARERVQLVISDHNMPDMTGVEFLKLIRERHPGVMRMMLSADPDSRLIARSIKEGGVFWFLRKPWDNTVLRVTVYLALERAVLEEENQRLVAALRQQLAFLDELEKECPGEADRARRAATVLRTAHAALGRPAGD